MVKSKRTVVTRSMPRRKKTGNRIDPRAIALSAGAGALVGGEIAKSRNSKNAQKSVANMVAGMSRTKRNAYSTPQEDVAASARDVYKNEYNRMPRAPQGKVDTYNKIKSESGGWDSTGKPSKRELANYNAGYKKTAGLTKAEAEMVTNKKRARLNDLSYSTKTYMDTASRIKAASTAKGAVRRGRAVGGVSAAAVSAIVQAVLNELNKK